MKEKEESKVNRLFLLVIYAVFFCPQLVHCKQSAIFPINKAPVKFFFFTGEKQCQTQTQNEEYVFMFLFLSHFLFLSMLGNIKK